MNASKDIIKLAAELKSDNLQYSNKISYITLVVLFRCHQVIATRSSAVTQYTDLLGTGKTAHFMNEKIC